jgi:WD40 repeat protein
MFKVWDLKTGKEVHILIGHSSGIWGVSVSPDGNYTASTYGTER